MNRSIIVLLVITLLISCGSINRAPETSTEVHANSTINVNANQRFQTIIGLGVNGQPRLWGTGAAARPALAALAQEMNARVWRVEINSGLSNWEATNDDGDPFTFNWAYYDALFQTKPFADLWAYVRYLNSLGVTDIELAAHGTAPAWMGGINVPGSQYDEYVETQLALLEYAAVRIPDPKPVFNLFSPFNEPDVSSAGFPEGIVLTAGQAGTVLGKFATRLAAEQAAHPELAAIQLVPPDVGSDWNAVPGTGYNLEAVSNVPTGMLRAIGYHRYDLTTNIDWAGASPSGWVTETSAMDTVCGTATWNHATGLAQRSLNFLKSGVETVLVWTEWDAPHAHDDDAWRTYGLLGTSIPGVGCGSFPVLTNAQFDAAVYTKKPTYHAFRQIAAFVQPGARRIQATTTDSDLSIVAVQNPDDSVAVVGYNSGAAGTVTVNLSGASATVLTVWSTTSSTAFVQGPPVLAASGSASFAIPANSVFAIAPTPGTSCTPTMDAGSDVLEGGSDGGVADVVAVDATAEDGTGAEVSADGGGGGGAGDGDADQGDEADGGSVPADGSIDDGSGDAIGGDADAGDSGVADATSEAGAPRVLVGEPTQWSSADWIDTGKIEAFKYTATVTGIATKLFFYATVSGRATKLGLYTHNAGSNQPQTLLASGAFTSSVGWNQVTVPASAVTSGATYWIAVLSTNGQLNFVEKSGGSGLGSVSTPSGFSALPATWSATGQQRWGSSGMSAYARE